MQISGSWQRSSRGRTTFTLATALAGMLFALPRTAAAGTGTVQERLLTFTGPNTATFTVNTADLVPTDGNTPTVALLMDFATDGSASVPASDPFTSPDAVTFALSYAGSAIAGFSFTAKAAQTSPFVNATASVPASLTLFAKQLRPGEYYVAIGFPAGATGLTGDWTLALSGAGVPADVRGDLYIEQGKLKALATTGACGSGGGSCPAGQACRWPCWWPPPNICRIHPPICEVVVATPVWFNWPPNPCLSCPDPWQIPLEEGWERVLVTVAPETQLGTPLGPDHAKDVQVNIEGGRPVGGVIDLGGGQYGQMLEARKADASPRVSVTVAGKTSRTIVAGSRVAARTDGKIYLLAALVLAAAFLVTALFRRRGAREG